MRVLLFALTALSLFAMLTAEDITSGYQEDGFFVDIPQDLSVPIMIWPCKRHKYWLVDD